MKTNNPKQTHQSEFVSSSALPVGFREFGIFLHELGHKLRKKSIGKNPELNWASQEAHAQFIKKFQATALFSQFSQKLSMNLEQKISPYQTRKIETNEERGAWAIGISLIREVGKIIGLDCASSEAVKEMLKKAEDALSTYDEVPYTLLGHPEDQPIPAFSSSKKREANVLHREIKNNGLNYSSLPSFDSETGENLATKPRKLLEILAKLREKNSSDSQKE